MAKRASHETQLIHVDERHQEASGGWIEYDTTVEYHLDPASQNTHVREYSSCDNARNPREGWDRRLESEKILTLDELPKHIRKKAMAALRQPKPKP